MPASAALSAPQRISPEGLSVITSLKVAGGQSALGEPLVDADGAEDPGQRAHRSTIWRGSAERPWIAMAASASRDDKKIGRRHLLVSVPKRLLGYAARSHGCALDSRHGQHRGLELLRPFQELAVFRLIIAEELDCASPKGPQAVMSTAHEPYSSEHGTWHIKRFCAA